MKSLSEDREHLKERIWNTLCFKEYKTISDDQFLKIIINQAKKTYHRYGRFYEDLQRGVFVRTSEKLKSQDLNCSRLLIQMYEVRDTFRQILQRTKKQQEFDALIEDLYSLSMKIFKAYCLFVLVIEEKTVAA